VDDLNAWPNACILPSWVVTRVVLVPRGATPSYADGYYARDNFFYTAWDKISRDRDTFERWMKTHIHGTPGFAEYLQSLKTHAAAEAN
jgi:glutaconate CoA-transferase subunit A